MTKHQSWLKRPNQAGFTIVELMVALSVLSVILVMAAIILIQISNLYSKGVNSANLQNITRTVESDVSNSLQLSSQLPAHCTSINTTCAANTVSYTGPTGSFTVNSYCVGDVRYSFVMDRELGIDNGVSPALTTPHVLWRDTLKSIDDPCTPVDIAQPNPVDPNGYSNNDGEELMGTHMRLTRFYISPYNTSNFNDVFQVDVWTAFGDSDLLTSNSYGSSRCNGASADQFCAVSSISSYVTGRTY